MQDKCVQRQDICLFVCSLHSLPQPDVSACAIANTSATGTFLMRTPLRNGRKNHDNNLQMTWHVTWAQLQQDSVRHVLGISCSPQAADQSQLEFVGLHSKCYLNCSSSGSRSKEWSRKLKYVFGVDKNLIWCELRTVGTAKHIWFLIQFTIKFPCPMLRLGLKLSKNWYNIYRKYVSFKDNRSSIPMQTRLRSLSLLF